MKRTQNPLFANDDDSYAPNPDPAYSDDPPSRKRRRRVASSSGAPRNVAPPPNPGAFPPETPDSRRALRGYKPHRYNSSITNNYLLAPSQFYIPQLNDIVYFVAPGYEAYLEAIRKDPVDRLVLWEGRGGLRESSTRGTFGDLRRGNLLGELEPCEILGIDYVHREVRQGIFATFLRLRLARQMIIAKMQQENPNGPQPVPHSLPVDKRPEFEVEYVESPCFSTLRVFCLQSQIQLAHTLEVSPGTKRMIYVATLQQSFNCQIIRVLPTSYCSLEIAWVYEGGELGEERERYCFWEVLDIAPARVAEALMPRTKALFPEANRLGSINLLREVIDEYSDDLLYDPELANVAPYLIPPTTIMNRLKSSFHRNFAQFLFELRHANVTLRKNDDAGDPRMAEALQDFAEAIQKIELAYGVPPILEIMERAILIRHQREAEERRMLAAQRQQLHAHHHQRQQSQPQPQPQPQPEQQQQPQQQRGGLRGGTSAPSSGGRGGGADDDDFVLDVDDSSSDDDDESYVVSSRRKPKAPKRKVARRKPKPKQSNQSNRRRPPQPRARPRPRAPPKPRDAFLASASDDEDDGDYVDPAAERARKREELEARRVARAEKRRVQQERRKRGYDSDAFPNEPEIDEDYVEENRETKAEKRRKAREKKQAEERKRRAEEAAAKEREEREAAEGDWNFEDVLLDNQYKKKANRSF